MSGFLGPKLRPRLNTPFCVYCNRFVVLQVGGGVVFVVKIVHIFNVHVDKQLFSQALALQRALSFVELESVFGPTCSSAIFLNDRVAVFNSEKTIKILQERARLRNNSDHANLNAFSKFATPES